MENKEDCIFCEIAKGEIKSEKLYEDDNFFAILDIKPKAEGHTLIISKKHFANLLDVPDSLGGELIASLKEVILKIFKDKKAEGFNVVINGLSAGGQIIPHFHAHIIPRKNGDGLRMLV